MFAALAFAFAVVGPSPTSEPPAELLVLPVEYPREVPPHVSSAIEEGLREGVSRGGVDARVVDDGAPCVDRACWLRVADEQHATELLRTVVHRTNDRDYALELVLIDPRGGEIMSRSSACDLCGVAEVKKSVENMAAAIATRFLQLPRGPGVLRISSRPPGASVFVDGDFVTKTPERFELSPGHHVIELRSPGFGSVRREVDTVSGEELELLLHLEPDGAFPDNGKGRRYSPAGEAAGWSLLALSPAAIAVGAWLVSIDGDPYEDSCTEDMPEIGGRCPKAYSTQAGGISLLTVGSAGLVTGIALLAWQLRERKGRRRSQARLEPRVGGLAIRF